MSMFGNTNKKKEIVTATVSSSANPSNGGSNSLNSLVYGTQIEGNIHSESDIRIDGAIKGNLTCNAKVIIGPSGLIEGEIFCKNALIEGRFEGILNIEEVLHIKEKARVVGEIKASKLIVQPGAVINGSFDMSPDTSILNGGNGTTSTKETLKYIESATEAK